MSSHGALAALAAALVLCAGPAPVRESDGRARQERGQVTILYDAFGDNPAMVKDWGFAALVEHGGKRILFDTGNNAEIFARNVAAAGADLRSLDFVVVSHRHLDHTAGLSYLLRVNPGVRIYAPRESFGVFGSALASGFYRRQDSLPARMRYYDGHPRDTLSFGTAWPGGRFVPVDSSLEVAPGVYLISLVSEAPGTRELREVSLAVKTRSGMVVIAGCSHPGIDRIVAEAARIDPHVHLIFGGFHLPAATDQEIGRIAHALHDTYHVDRVAPGHCPGEPAFYVFSRLWKERYTYAGVGTVVPLP
jgi:7,8-dihydropterin-6-yl-methyl-4-(beta-D-ribofuranosyl)aminobenzene 5'-phosphate synthase